MNEQMNAVPSMISCKDLDYLSDMFNWNYGAYKATVNAESSVADEELKQVLTNASGIFKETMMKVLNILNGGENE